MPKIRCECKRVLSYRPELAGKVVKCPGCSAKIRLPEAEPAALPARPTPVEEQDLQLERNEDEIPLAASVPTSDGTAPSGVSLPPYEPPSWAEPAALRRRLQTGVQRPRITGARCPALSGSRLKEKGLSR